MSHPAKTKNDHAWEALFEMHHIPDVIERDGRFVISSRRINRFREARLMTKFDHRKNLPAIFQEHNLSILPITRGDYVIAKFNAYEKIDEVDEHLVEQIPFPDHIQSITFPITSEASAIHCAYVSGILAHFFDDEKLLPTVSGRMGSGSFDFQIENNITREPINLQVTNAQIEVDGGYEGQSCLWLLEAKASIASDFLVRQLYYPFRLWRGRVLKEVCPIFLIFSNGIFHLYRYEFTEPKSYNSIRLLKQQQYRLEERNISQNDIVTLLDSVQPVQEPPLPFPQADSFNRIINLCELLFEANELSKDDITTTYDFDARQTDYYTNAGRYLGLIDRRNDEGVTYFLTDQGTRLFWTNYRQRQLGFAEAVLRHAVFAQTLRLSIQQNSTPSIDQIIPIMKDANLHNIRTESTFRRRASTILSWVNWIWHLST